MFFSAVDLYIIPSSYAYI